MMTPAWDGLSRTRWPEGITCPKCGQVTKHHRVTTGPSTPALSVGITSPRWPAPSWNILALLCAFGSSNVPDGVHQVRNLRQAVGARTWRDLQDGLEDVQTDSVDAHRRYYPGGVINRDRCYFRGGKAKNMHKAKRERLGGRGTVGKTAVLGMVERQGRGDRHRG